MTIRLCLVLRKAFFHKDRCQIVLFVNFIYSCMFSSMTIRPYETTDQQAVLDIFRLNTPEFFDADEEQDLIEYLNNRLEDYFVVEHEGEVLGAGGVNYMEDAITARISWDMIHPRTQGKGIGSVLVKHRIKHIKSKSSIQVIVVRTSQVAFKFYAKFGFEVIAITKNYWAIGFDLYYMELKLV